MNFLSWLFGSSAAADTVRAIGDAADKLTTTDEERGAQQVSDNASARAYAAPGVHNTWFDVFVDGLNRLPRPVIALYVFGGIAGAWRLADLSRVDPLWLAVGAAVLGFYFGGRFLTKDLPAAVVNAVMAIRKG